MDDGGVLRDYFLWNMEPRGGVTTDSYGSFFELTLVFGANTNFPDLMCSVKVCLAKLVSVFLGA